MNSCNHTGKTDNMVSSRSITSVKSVSIPSHVKDCHFWDHEVKNFKPCTEEWEDGITIEFSEEDDKNLDADKKPTDNIAVLLPPIYSTMKSNNL